jgi:hypothetical protein
VESLPTAGLVCHLSLWPVPSVNAMQDVGYTVLARPPLKTAALDAGLYTLDGG